ncbi:hypothetical protein CE91St32_11520 [Gordonibacter pamelaeae]|uniref:zinc-ribbon domain-containing protein n=1 Tax=Gordonibacter urolithinfaciens TaxID=1335613 RepID=UPI00207FA1CA|nr:hypothetical protein CE91St32_11520 [Gordonibacter pamelaeae]
MCIPCVMCGACMADESGEHIDDGRCPECGEPVLDNAVSCPKCFTFLYRPSNVMASTIKKYGTNETHATAGSDEPGKPGKTGEPAG